MINNKSWKILLILGISFNAISPTSPAEARVSTRREDLLYIVEGLSELTNELEHATRQIQELSRAINSMDIHSGLSDNWSDEAIKWGRFGGLDVDSIQEKNPVDRVPELIRQELGYELDPVLPALQELATILRVRNVNTLSDKDRVYAAIKGKIRDIAFTAELASPETFESCEQIIQTRLDTQYTVKITPQLNPADIAIAQRAVGMQNLYKDLLFTHSKSKIQLELELERSHQLTKIIVLLEKRRGELLATGTTAQKLRIAQTARGWFRLRSEHALEFKRINDAHELLKQGAIKVVEPMLELRRLISTIERSAGAS